MHGDTLYITPDMFMQGGVYRDTDEPFTIQEIEWLETAGAITSERADITQLDFEHAGFSHRHAHQGTAVVLPPTIRRVIAIGCADYYFLIRDQSIEYIVYDTIHAWRASHDYPWDMD